MSVVYFLPQQNITFDSSDIFSILAYVWSKLESSKGKLSLLPVHTGLDDYNLKECNIAHNEELMKDILYKKWYDFFTSFPNKFNIHWAWHLYSDSKWLIDGIVKDYNIPHIPIKFFELAREMWPTNLNYKSGDIRNCNDNCNDVGFLTEFMDKLNEEVYE